MNAKEPNKTKEKQIQNKGCEEKDNKKNLNAISELELSAR